MYTHTHTHTHKHTQQHRLQSWGLQVQVPIRTAGLLKPFYPEQRLDVSHRQGLRKAPEGLPPGLEKTKTVK